MLDDTVPAGDGPTPLNSVRERRVKRVYQQQLPWAAMRLDTWEATNVLRLFLESLPKRSDCPRQDNRPGEEVGGAHPDRRVDPLTWNAAERVQGKAIKLQGLPKDPCMRLFRVEVSYPPPGLGRDPRSHSRGHGGYARGGWLPVAA